MLHVVFLIEYLIKEIKKNLYELWRKREPNLKYLKVWGCLVKVNIPINKKRKIEKKNINYILLDIFYIILLIDA